MGGFTRGSCEECKSAPLFAVDDRSFKSITGTATTQCTKCTTCGGANSDGTEYEASPCTTTTDASCQPCGNCTTGLLLGCSGTSPGKCFEVGLHTLHPAPCTLHPAP